MNTPAKLRILLAEDNIVNQKVAIALLKKLGYSADVVVNGAEVLSTLERTSYDCILMDVQMPVMDGIEATRRVRARGGDKAASVPWIIAMTANVMQSDRDQCFAAGMNDFVSKPVQAEDLLTALKRAETQTGTASEGEASGEQASEIPLSRAANDHGTLDSSVFEKLASEFNGISSPHFQKIVTTFLTSTPKSLARIDEAASQGDWKTVELTVHSLKSTAATFGAMKLSGLAQVLEAECRQNMVADAPAKILSIKAEFERVQAAVRELTGF